MRVASQPPPKLPISAVIAVTIERLVIDVGG